MSFQPPSQPSSSSSPLAPPASDVPTSQQPTSSPFGAPSGPAGPGTPGGAGAFPPGRPAGPPTGPPVGPPGGPMFNPAVGYSPLPPKRSTGATLFTILVFLVPLIGLGVGAFIYFSTKDDAEDQVREVQEAIDGLSDDITVPDFSLPEITMPEITAPTITTPEVTLPGTATTVPPTTPDTMPPETVAPETTVAETVPPETVPPVTNLWTPEGVAQVLGAFETTISGDPSRFLTINVYDTYAFADAQDANIPEHVDNYPFRDGVVGTSSPVQLIGDGDLNAALFSITDFDATQIPRLVAEAPGLTSIEEPEVVYVRIERSIFIEGGPVTLKVYINGPRGGGYVEYDVAGTLLQVVE